MSYITDYTTPDGFNLKLQTGLFINNEFVGGSETIDVLDPSTEKLITSVQAGGAEEIDLAVKAAHEAFHNVWRYTSAQKRGKLLYKLAELVERDADELAHIEALDIGKPLATARSFDVAMIPEYMRYYAGWCDKIHGKVVDTEGTLTYIRHEPFGVCGGIIPWNVPLIMFAMKVAPALATGNVIVIKPSEIGPLSSIKMAALIKEAGFPPGVVNVVTGYGATAGDALARHPLVRKIAFTGSGAVGRLVMKAAAETNLKKVTLELGGKSPNIFFDDISDLDKAVSWAYKAIYMNAGQICLAGSRIYVQEGIYDKFLEKFKQLVLAAKVGSPWDDGVIQGPQISQKQMERVLEYIDVGKKEGATCLLGGNRHGNQGYFIEPTVFTDVSPDMRIMKEEIFGPVAAISKFNDIDEVVKEANDTEYGLAAGVFTSNVKTAIEVSNKLESGAVWVNHYLSADVYAPFGGYKQSGIGRENSEYSLQEYYQIKTVKINLKN